MYPAKDACKCLELKDDAGTICRELDEQDKVTLSREEFIGGFQIGVSFVQWIREFDSADLAESGNSRITLISESRPSPYKSRCCDSHQKFDDCKNRQSSGSSQRNDAL